MEIWQAIVLGAVQGFTEFLPVSSSGHLILLQNWFGITENTVFYTVMLHIGTLIPVILVLYKEIAGLFKEKWRRFFLLVLATIPAGIFGIVFEKFVGIEELFESHIWLLSVTFALTAAELILAEIRAKKTALENPINVKTALTMGFGQAVGVLPGISRSGSTLTAGTLAKVKPEENAAFTFLMSIPIILAAAFLSSLEIIKNGSIGSVSALPLAFGVLTAAITGYIAVKFMLSVIKKSNYKWFSAYLILLSAANLIVYFVK